MRKLWWLVGRGELEWEGCIPGTAAPGPDTAVWVPLSIMEKGLFFSFVLAYSSDPNPHAVYTKSILLPD